MQHKRGMTQEQILYTVMMLIVLGILLYLAYNYILKGGEKAATLGSCETKPGQTCMSKADVDAGRCQGQAIKFGCTNKDDYCCVKTT